MAGEGGHGQQADVAVPPAWSSRAGQVALVTGGSAGPGLAIATALAAAGSDVVLASRSAERCQQAAARVSAQTGRQVTGCRLDVTDEAAVAALVDRVLTDPGRLDVLVTSAGCRRAARLMSSTSARCAPAWKSTSWERGWRAGRPPGPCAQPDMAAS